MKKALFFLLSLSAISTGIHAQGGAASSGGGKAALDEASSGRPLLESGGVRPFSGGTGVDGLPAATGEHGSERD